MQRAGPDFLGIGMQKSGTTYLYAALRLAKSVQFPAMPGAKPWLRNPVVDGKTLNTLPKEIQFLAGPNAGWTWEEYLSIFDGAPAGVVQGEISPSYAEAAPDRIAQLAKHCPHVRLFCVLRNPVERDWSAIRMIAHRRGQLENLGALREIAMLPHVQQMGAYAGQLSHWLSVFPAEQFLFVTNEALEQDPARVVGAVLSHIGAAGQGAIALPPARVFEGPRANCPPEIADLLAARHAGSASEVAAMTGLDVSHWGQTVAPAA